MNDRNTQPAAEALPTDPNEIGSVTVAYKSIRVNGTTVMNDMRWVDGIEWLTPEVQKVVLAEARKQYVVFGAHEVVATEDRTRANATRIVNPESR